MPAGAKLIRRVFAIAITLALLAWLLIDRRFLAVGDAASRLQVGTLLLALAGLLASYATRALRIRAEFGPLPGRFVDVLRVMLVHNAWVNVLPFRAGELAFPLLMRQHFNVATERALASLLWLRMQDACVLALLAVLALPAVPLSLRAALAAAVLLTAAGLRFAAKSRGPLPFGWLQRLRSSLSAATGSPWQTWLWTLLNWAIKMAALTLLLGALLPAPSTIALAGALGAEVAAVLPVQGVAGFGTYEAGAAAMLAPAGVPLQAALPAALLMHLVVIASAVLAGLWAWATLPGGASARES